MGEHQDGCNVLVFVLQKQFFVVRSNYFGESNDELLLLISSLQLWLVKVVLQLLPLGLDHCVACVVELLDLQKPLMKNLVKACKSFLE